MMTIGKRLALGLFSGALLFAFSMGQARADGPSQLIEKGQPGSGIKEIKHVYNNSGLRSRLKVEASRETTYENGDVVLEIFYPNGGVHLKTFTSKKGHTIKEEFRRLPKNQLWVRSTDIGLGQIVREYYGPLGHQRLIRVMHKNGNMDVMFSDTQGNNYVQHWLSGFAGYSLTSVDVSIGSNTGSERFVLRGRTVTQVELRDNSGTIFEVRILRPNGSIERVEHWSQGKLQNTTPGGGKQQVPSWTFHEIGGVDDPTVPR